MFTHHTQQYIAMTSVNCAISKIIVSTEYKVALIELLPSTV